MLCVSCRVPEPATLYEIVTATTKFISMITTTSPLLDFLPATSRNTGRTSPKASLVREIPIQRTRGYPDLLGDLHHRHIPWFRMSPYRLTDRR